MFKYTREILTTIGIGFRTRANKLRLVMILFSTFAIAGANLFAPYFLSHGLHFLFEDEGEESLKEYLEMLGFAGLWTLSRVLHAYRITLLSRPTADLSGELAQKIVRCSYGRPMQVRFSHSPARESQHFSNVFEHIADNFLKTTFSSVLPAAIEIIGSNIILGVTDYFVGFFLFVTVLLYSVSEGLFNKYIDKTQDPENNKAYEIFESFTERITQYEAAHHNDNVEYELRQLKERLNVFYQENLKSVRKREAVNALQTIIIGLGFTGILYFSASRYRSNVISSHAFVWVNLYISQFACSLLELSRSVSLLIQANIKFKELYDYFEEQHDSIDDTTKPNLIIRKLVQDNYLDGIAQQGSSGYQRASVNQSGAEFFSGIFDEINSSRIDFTDVSLYFSNKEILRNITFSVEPGETVAIIGESGSGKSSLFNLLLGFFHATHGKIKIADTDLTKVNKKSIRANIVVMPQMPFLFNCPITDNIVYAKREATEEQIERVVEQTQLTRVIQSYGDNKIGEDGKKLSPGQRQQISIARVLLKLLYGVSIVLVDDPTSALDAETGNFIMGQIFNVCQSVTALVITHNLRYVNRHCVDKVIVMEKGKIEEQGSVSDLLSRKGFFSRQVASAGIEEKELLEFPLWFSEQKGKKVSYNDEKNEISNATSFNSSGMISSSHSFREKRKKMIETTPLLCEKGSAFN